MARFEKKGLIKEDDRWRFSFEWGAIQPQRMRLVKPLLFVTAKESTSVEFTANVFADGFPQPVTLQATLDVTVEQVKASVGQLIPNLQSIMSSDDDSKIAIK